MRQQRQQKLPTKIPSTMEISANLLPTESQCKLQFTSAIVGQQSIYALHSGKSRTCTANLVAFCAHKAVQSTRYYCAELLHSAGLHSAMYLSTKLWRARCPSLVHSAFKTKSAKCKLCRPVPTWSRLVAPTSAAPGLGVELVQLLSSAECIVHCA